jgi:two-component system cell cycle response regulator DivK
VANDDSGSKTSPNSSGRPQGLTERRPSGLIGLTRTGMTGPLRTGQTGTLRTPTGSLQTGQTGSLRSSTPTGSLRTGQTGSLVKDATVLVVEDNVANFVLIARLLGYMGIHCEWKTSGYEVVEYADALPHLDLILMDIRLPYEDGYGALRKIRSSSSLKQTRVVAVTAEASEEQLRKAREAAFDGFLGKPIDPDRFPEQIRRILTGESVWELT